MEEHSELENGVHTVPDATVIWETVSSKSFDGRLRAYPEREPSCLQAKIWLCTKHLVDSHWQLSPTGPYRGVVGRHAVFFEL